MNPDAEDNDSTAEINRLRRENEELRTRLADAEGEGCTLHGHAKHGKEAEELRKGIERLAVADVFTHCSELLGLLDRVDARDSLSHIRANQELRYVRAANKRGLRSQEKACAVLLDALVDGLDSGTCSTKAIRKALVALGAKAGSLPQDIPPAGGKRGRGV